MGEESFEKHLEAALRKMRKEPDLRISFQDGESQDPQKAVERIARDQLELVALSMLLQHYQRRGSAEPGTPPPGGAAKAYKDDPKRTGKAFDANA